MAHFVVDEDLPRSLVRALQDVGLEADHVIECGLRGQPDGSIFDHAVANVLRFPRGSHHGIVVTRFPNGLPTTTMNADIVRVLGDLSDEELRGNLVILEPGRIRLRRGR